MTRISTITSFLTFIIFALSHSADAQSNIRRSSVSPVRVGSGILNLGIGVGAEYNGDYYNAGFGTKIAAEWGIWHAGPGVITLGGEFGGSFSNDGYYSDYRTRTMVIAFRSAWHYGWKVHGLDTYGGLSAGLGFHHYEYKNNGSFDRNQVLAVPGAFIGASYFISPRFGFNTEAGYDITRFQVGLVFKIK